MNIIPKSGSKPQTERLFTVFKEGENGLRIYGNQPIEKVLKRFPAETRHWVERHLNEYGACWLFSVWAHRGDMSQAQFWEVAARTVTIDGEDYSDPMGLREVLLNFAKIAQQEESVGGEG